jgi:hypothetical protein
MFTTHQIPSFPKPATPWRSPFSLTDTKLKKKQDKQPHTKPRLPTSHAATDVIFVPLPYLVTFATHSSAGDIHHLIPAKLPSRCAPVRSDRCHHFSPYTAAMRRLRLSPPPRCPPPAHRLSSMRQLPRQNPGALVQHVTHVTLSRTPTIFYSCGDSRHPLSPNLINWSYL